MVLVLSCSAKVKQKRNMVLLQKHKNNNMNTLLIFLILSIPITVISYRNLYQFTTHGFYRFLSWECILWLFASNYRYWFVDPFGIFQLISWILLIAAALVVILGTMQLRKSGNVNESRADANLFAFEKTTRLVDTGIYRFIRHPLYASLIYLGWGIILKNITPVLVIIASLSTLFLFITARLDEKECLEFFGESYRKYMKRSKMFVPFIL
jgi:protein-S-isoprenylcysteine O-methyltransferase Ste14